MHLYYSAADLVCLPSTEEGWPNVLMESFACGCPAVASDVGGVADIIALTGSGKLAPAAEPVTLARRLEEALTQIEAGDWPRAVTAKKMVAHTLEHTAERYTQTCADAISA